MRTIGPVLLLSLAIVSVVDTAACAIAPSSGRKRVTRKATRETVKTPPMALSSILIDAVSGQVLFEHDPDALRPPASTTKIMTAIMLLEHTKPDEPIIAPGSVSDIEGTALHLKPGETLSARDMLYALMLRSANDGCLAIAEHVAGTEPKFAEMMTKRAHEIGATKTQFRNSNGLPASGHLTTARDLATMARFASRFASFNDAVRSRSHRIHRSSEDKDVSLRNTAKFLWRYDGADGIKTGWTTASGKCFVGSATRNGWRLISVVMHSPDAFGETARLMDTGFTKYRRVLLARQGTSLTNAPVSGGDKPTVPGILKDDFQVAVSVDSKTTPKLEVVCDNLCSPIKAGQRVGVVRAVVNNVVLVQSEMVAGADIPSSMAVVSKRASNRQSWKWMIVGLVGMVMVWHVSPIAKASRLRRYRVKARLRNNYINR